MVSATFVEGTWLLGVGDLLGSIGRLRPLAVMCDKTTVAPGEVEDDMYRARRGADVSLEVDSGGTSDVRSWERRRSWKRRIGWDLLVVTRQRLMCTDVSMEMDRSCSRYQSRGDSEAALRCPGDLTRPHRSFFFFLGKDTSGGIVVAVSVWFSLLPRNVVIGAAEASVIPLQEGPLTVFGISCPSMARRQNLLWQYHAQLKEDGSTRGRMLTSQREASRTSRSMRAVESCRVLCSGTGTVVF